jgi:hypothetical protein
MAHAYPNWQARIDAALQRSILLFLAVAIVAIAAKATIHFLILAAILKNGPRRSRGACCGGWRCRHCAERRDKAIHLSVAMMLEKRLVCFVSLAKTPGFI